MSQWVFEGGDKPLEQVYEVSDPAKELRRGYDFTYTPPEDFLAKRGFGGPR
jgi:hypothetical protein